MIRVHIRCPHCGRIGTTSFMRSDANARVCDLQCRPNFEDDEPVETPDFGIYDHIVIWMREGTLVDNPFSNARWMDDFDVLAYLAEVDEEEEINKGYNIPTVEVKTKKPFTFKPLTKTG